MSGIKEEADSSGKSMKNNFKDRSFAKEEYVLRESFFAKSEG